MQIKKILCLLLCLTMLVSMLAGCGGQETPDPGSSTPPVSDNPLEDSTPPVETDTPSVDYEAIVAALNVDESIKPELVRASQAGFPMSLAEQATISGSELVELLDIFLASEAPDKLSEWKELYPALRSDTQPLTRFNAMAAIFLATRLAGEDYASVDASAAGSLSIDWNKDYLKWELYGGFDALPMFDVGQGESYLDGAAYAYFLGRISPVTNEYPFAIDEESNSLRVEDNCTYAEALLAIVRLMDASLIDKIYLVALDSEEARTPVLADNTIALANELPAAAWNDLPVWNGVTLGNMQQYDWLVCGQPQVFSKEDVENIAALGFNFIRVPLDTRLFFDMDDPSKVRLDRLQNLDDLISWCAEYGIHLCPDVHFSFGFTTDENIYNDTMWNNPQEQEIFIEFWNLMANRYKDVPSNLLSFNLMNEPTNNISEEQYVSLMRKAISAIREYTLDRLIFVDMLNTGRDPVYALAQDRVAQSCHFYEPQAMTAGMGNGSWPMYNCGGFIEREDGFCGVRLTGNFPAGTSVKFAINSIHKSGKLIIAADEKKIFEYEFGKDTPGENGCIGVYEEGTGGEYRDYDLSHIAVLPEDTSKVEIYAEGDCYWFGLKALQVVIGEKKYSFQPLDVSTFLPEGTTLEDSKNPNIVFNEDGSVSNEGDLFFSVVDKNYMNDRFAEYRAFTEETGVEVMLQEFGVWYEADYEETLAWFDDLLSTVNENDLNWCGWDYFGVYSFYAVNDYEMREGATYEPFSNGHIATELYEVFKSHLVTGN